MTHDIRDLMSRISIKALVLSNLAFWAVGISGMILTSALYWGAVAIAFRHGPAPAPADYIPATLVGAWMAVFCLAAPLLAGYFAARIAPHAKLLNAVLAMSTWLLFSVYSDIWVNDGDTTLRWLDLLGSYWVPLPVMMGAYLWQRRASRSSLVIAQA